ncbi:MAG: glutamate 5-kinase [Oscillospiraceae bacterium]|nr:glutamate 5-kinase [Oscillospiraceae bacterium]
MRLVIKIGTSTLSHPTGHPNIRHIENFCKVVSDIKNSGNEVIIVSSGAVSMGRGKAGVENSGNSLAMKQALAAIGQSELMYTYDKYFGEYNHTVAQLLLTASSFIDAQQYENFISTMNKLLELNVIPIINENDTVATQELKIGDNDTLSARVAVSVSADLLILLTDIDGLFTADPNKDPNATLLTQVNEITPEIEAIAGGASSKVGTGGMATKIEAAKIAMEDGCDMVIANGKNPAVLYDILEGKQVGTKFTGEKRN